MKSRKQLEAEVIAKYKKASKYWNISETDAENRAKQLMQYNSDSELRAFLKMPLKSISVNYLDPAHRESDREIARMSIEIQKTYQTASNDMKTKLDKYLKQFKADVAKKQKELKDGKITQEGYDNWYKSALEKKILQTKQWKEMRDSLSRDAVHSNDIAREIVSDHISNVYANNFNFGTYTVEKLSNVDTAFSLYDRQTVARLMLKDRQLLPSPSRSSLAKYKDKKWNEKQIQSALLQGILQGESIDDLSDRLRKVCDMNRTASVRYARTMTTGAENAGRSDSYERAKKGGINVEPAWMATLDGRTRDSHRRLDGEIRNPETGKYSNGCRYPGDPQGRPEEVYNCRCTEVAQLKGFEMDFSDMSWRRTDNLVGSYDEWKFEHEKISRNSDKLSSLSYERIKNEVKKDDGLSYNKPGKWDIKDQAKLNSKTIVREIARSEPNDGSCSSVAFAYIGNKSGYKVHDFKNKSTSKYFGQMETIIGISKFTRVKSETIWRENDFEAARELLAKVEEGKEYYFAVGKHAAIVRRHEGHLQYLELQTSNENYNGYRNFKKSTLRDRFGCLDNHRNDKDGKRWPNTLIDVETLAKSKEFANILGYINSDQK